MKSHAVDHPTASPGDDVRRDVADAGFEEGGTGDDDDDIYG